MKIASIIFIVLGMFGSLTGLFSNILNFYGTSYALYIVISVFTTILSLGFGIGAIVSMAYNKKYIWLGVGALLCCGILGGIFYLLYIPETPIDEEYQYDENSYVIPKPSIEDIREREEESKENDITK